ncbi:MAG: sigma-70 family RNA polymerase sigma factor [Verrucomicrobia bacterium]|nr:sigma-70 family RNA polymerase sigma factor [Verrucomicrobiota bacterium]
MDDSLEPILDRVLAGEMDAYAHIVRQFQDDIWRIAAYGLRDIAATEDLVQQVFVSAYQNLNSFERGRDFGAWLRTIARNLLRNELRRGGREADHLRRYHEWLITRLEHNPHAEPNEGFLRDHLRECRAKITGHAADALRLRYEDGMGFEEIAAKLGRTIEAARQMLVRVRIELRQCIEKRRLETRHGFLKI